MIVLYRKLGGVLGGGGGPLHPLGRSKTTFFWGVVSENISLCALGSTFFSRNLLNTSARCAFDKFRVDTHLCKLRDTSNFANAITELN